MTPIEILALPMQDNDADAATIKDYLKALLSELWREQEGFSGKRPFGNSDWTKDLVLPLVKANVINGRVDENGYLDGCDSEAGNRAILSAIDAL